MKFLRILLFCFVGIAVLLAVIVALAFNSGVQTWATHRAIADLPGIDLKIDTVSAGLGVTRVDNIHLVQPGLALAVPSVEVQVSLLDAARNNVDVKRVVAKGWTLDLSQPVTTAPVAKPESAPEAARQAFAGIFEQLKLPVNFTLGELDIEGDVILPAGQGTVHVTITGGNLASGQDGKIVFKASLASAKKDAAVGSMVLQSDIIVRMNTPRSFEHVSVVTNATATGEQFPKGADVHVVLDAARVASGGEAYAVVLQAGQKELVNLAVQVPAGTAPLTGTWKLDAHDTDVAPFTLGKPLPAFTATGQGTFTADRTFAELHATGQLNAMVDRLTALSPELSAIGKIDFATAFDVTRQGDFIRIDRFNAQVSGAKPVVSIAARQVLKFNPVTHVLEAALPADDLFLISVQGLPLAWARPFLKGMEVTGDDLRGEFAASARDGGFTLRPVVPLTLTQLNVTQDGKPLVRALDITLAVGGDYSPKGWQAELAQLSVVSGPSTLLKFSARAGQLAGANQPIKATGSFEADLPSLLAQPAAPAGLALLEGVARGDFTASITDKQEMSLTLQLANLVTKAHQPMPSVALYVRADRDANGRIDAQAPLVITHVGRKSDLTLGAVVQSVKDGTQIDAQLKSEALYIEDLQLFAGLVPPAPAPAPEVAVAPAPPEAKQKPQAGPVWAGLSGELKLALKKVVYSSSIQITDIGGAVKITPDAISLDALRAALGEAGVKADGNLSFNAKKKAQPYGLKADLTVTNFDPAPMLRSMDPSKPAQVEGKFDLTTHLAGRAAEPAGFKDTALGDVTLISRGGTLRVLSVNAGNAANAVSTAANMVGLFGALTGNAKATKYAVQGQAGAEVARQLSLIRYDQLNVVVARDGKQNVMIKDISLISPSMRLAGSGQITYAPGVPLMQQPLRINLQLGAREQFAESLRALKLIAGPADSLGYLPLAEPIKLDGSLQSIGTAQLQRLIDRALAN